MIKTWKAPAELSTVPGTWQVLRKYQLSPTRSFHAVHSILDSQPHAPDAFSLPAPYLQPGVGPCCSSCSSVSHIPSFPTTALLHEEISKCFTIMEDGILPASGRRVVGELNRQGDTEAVSKKI